MLQYLYFYPWISNLIFLLSNTYKHNSSNLSCEVIIMEESKKTENYYNNVKELEEFKLKLTKK